MRNAYSRTLTSGRITQAVHDVEYLSAIFQVDSGECASRFPRQRQLHWFSTPRLSLREDISKSFRDQCGERRASALRFALGFPDQIFFEPNCGSLHMSRHMVANSRGGDFDFLGVAGRCRNRLAEFAQCLDMALDRFADVAFGFFYGRACCNAAGEIGDIGGPVVLGFFEDYCVLRIHFFNSSAAVLRIDFKVPVGRSSPGWPGTVTTFGLDGWLVVAVTAGCPDLSPAATLELTNDISNLHGRRLKH